jgi:cell division protein FtsN
MRDRTNAEADAQRLAKTDLKTEVEEVDLKENGTWYRVYLTGFQSRREASKAARKLQTEGLIRDFLPVP